MDIEQVLAELKKVANFQSRNWERVIKTARKYAQMKAFGSITNSDGSFSTIDIRSRASYEEQFLEELVRDIVFAYREDAAVGQELMNVLQAKE